MNLPLPRPVERTAVRPTISPHAINRASLRALDVWQATCRPGCKVEGP